MAELLWGQVYYKEHFAGILREEPGERVSFTYDADYINAGLPAIAYTLPVRAEPYVSLYGLLPFFDNLVAEGWLEEAQKRLLGKRVLKRFELLLAFGQDLAGAVSVFDPEPRQIGTHTAQLLESKEAAVMSARASLSGVQPKLVAKEMNGVLRPTSIGEVSTHIVKFPSRHHDDLVTNEYLTTIAFKALMPEDDVVSLKVGVIKGFDEPALIIKRFDRDDNGARIHFEEFNQLLGYRSEAKYDGSYKSMSDFMYSQTNSMPTEVYRLYLRILAGLLLGNTDMHFKNFAMFHTPQGLRLTPSYDQVAALMYSYNTVALEIYNAQDLKIEELKPKHIIGLGQEYMLQPAAINMAVEKMKARLEAAKDSIAEAKLGSDLIKDRLIDIIGKRWNGTFASIGAHLSKKQ